MVDFPRIPIQTRRIGFVALLAIAAVAFTVALTVTLTASPNAGAWLLVSVIVLALALAGEIVLLVFGQAKDFDDSDAEWYDWEKEAKAGEELLLRCTSCRETFTLHDTGERPLRHACPHCGRSGVLKSAATPPSTGKA